MDNQLRSVITAAAQAAQEAGNKAHGSDAELVAVRKQAAQRVLQQGLAGLGVNVVLGGEPRQRPELLSVAAPLTTGQEDM